MIWCVVGVLWVCCECAVLYVNVDIDDVCSNPIPGSFSEGNKGAANVEEREYGIRPREETMNVPRELGGE